MLLDRYRPRTVDATACNQNASAAAQATLSYIASLSSGNFHGAIVGQNCGHGSQIADPNHMMGYHAIMDAIFDQTGQFPGIIGVDYEHDQIFTTTELAACNAILIDYWNRGGLVTINWAPHNPWLNDETDIAGNPGIWSDTRNQGTNVDEVNLRELVDAGTAIHTVWRRKLDRIATALQELEDAGVVVLWRPMQEMNGNWFWWGIATSPSDSSPYITIYRDMYDYLTHVKGLDNLLWVYSPVAYGNVTWDGIRPVDWCYPGDDYVDIVAGTAYNDDLTIEDYRRYLSFGKPLGMGEYGANSNGTFARSATTEGSFDNRNYLSTISLGDIPR